MNVEELDSFFLATPVDYLTAMTTPSLLTQLTQRDTLSQEEFALLLDKLSDNYYNPIAMSVSVPDTLYDDALELYERKYGVRAKVGASVALGTQNKRVLRKPMFSLNKIKQEVALALWKSKHPPPYVVSDKVDGISIQQTGSELTTRGDGFVGTNVDHLAVHLPIPATVGTVFVRAEIVMPNSIFHAKYATEMANPRNMTAGLVNCKHFDVATVRELTVLAYEWDDSAGGLLRPQSEQFQLLTKAGFSTPYHIVLQDVTVESLSALLVERKAAADYDIDGLVVVSDVPTVAPIDANPKHAIAFKMSGETVETRVIGVEWNVSKHGLLKPRIHVEPVSLSGVTIQWCSGFNAAFILDHGVGIGALLVMERSGDVIPYAREIIKPAPEGAQMPSIPYKWLEHKKLAAVSDRAGEVTVEEALALVRDAKFVGIPETAEIEQHGGENYFVWYEESAVDICTLEETEAQRIKALAEFCKKLDMKHVGEATVTKLYTAGYTTIHSLLTLTLEQVLAVEGFQLRGATRIIEAVRDAIADAPLELVAAASGVLGIGFGERKIRAVLDKIPTILELDLPLSDLVALLHDAGLQKTANLFASKLPALKRFLQAHPEIKIRTGEAPRSARAASVASPATVAASEASPKESLAGKTVVFSGYRSKETEDQIRVHGGKVTTSVSGKTNILIVAKLDMGKAKENKAREMGVLVIEAEAFRARFL